MKVGFFLLMLSLSILGDPCSKCRESLKSEWTSNIARMEMERHCADLCDKKDNQEDYSTYKNRDQSSSALSGLPPLDGSPDKYNSLQRDIYNKLSQFVNSILPEINEWCLEEARRPIDYNSIDPYSHIGDVNCAFKQLFQFHYNVDKNKFINMVTSCGIPDKYWQLADNIYQELLQAYRF